MTTRFPKDAADRYLREPDARDWQARLQIVRADFRQVSEFLALVEAWKSGPAFDILINNAAQTISHPPDYYRGLWAREAKSFAGPNWLLPTGETSQGLLKGEYPTPIANALFPADRVDEFGSPLDLRRENSWVRRLGGIRAEEMLEVQMVNNIAPFVLCNELLGNMKRSGKKHRFIVNVTAVEGQFVRAKSTRHPHTNMAKAALNMLTRTSAPDYAKDNIHMVSVDPGWMSHEGPHLEERETFVTPLEAVDSAARIYYPILKGLEGEPISGILLKDYRTVPW